MNYSSEIQRDTVLKNPVGLFIG